MNFIEYSNLILIIMNVKDFEMLSEYDLPYSCLKVGDRVTITEESYFFPCFTGVVFKAPTLYCDSVQIKLDNPVNEITHPFIREKFIKKVED